MIREIDLVTGEETVRDYTPEEKAEAAQATAEYLAQIDAQPPSLEQQVADLTAALESKGMISKADIAASRVKP